MKEKNNSEATHGSAEYKQKQMEKRKAIETVRG